MLVVVVVVVVVVVQVETVTGANQNAVIVKEQTITMLPDLEEISKTRSLDISVQASPINSGTGQTQCRKLLVRQISIAVSAAAFESETTFFPKAS